MLRVFALLCIALIVGCRTPNETVVGRANGRDLVVTEAEIQKRAKDRGLSRTVALRELRRESEMRAAIEMQREWKSRDDVYVEGVKARTHTDQPAAPDEDKIFEQVTAEQKKRAEARAAAFLDEEDQGNGEVGELDTTEAKQNIAADRLRLPSHSPEFEKREGEEGWQTLQTDNTSPPNGGFERLAKNKSKSQTPLSQTPTSKEKTPK